MCDPCNCFVSLFDRSVQFSIQSFPFCPIRGSPHSGIYREMRKRANADLSFNGGSHNEWPDAYGKLTGRPGVCMVTRGPGATHASTGVHTAMQDSTPMLLLVGQVARDLTTVLAL